MLNDFVAYLEAQVQNRSIYVWGAQGQGMPTVTADWIRKRETGEANANRAIRLWQQRVQEGYGQRLRAFDCSGLGMYWLQNLRKLYTKDLSANGMRAKCRVIARGELRRGDWVFRLNSAGRATHIGYVVDEALHVIEAMGRDDGVVKRALNASGAAYWNAYGRPDIFFAQAAQPAGEGGGKQAAWHAICTGGSVYLRTGPSKEHAALGVVYKNEPLLVLDARDGWHEAAACLNGSLHKGYISAKYVKGV